MRIDLPKGGTTTCTRFMRAGPFYFFFFSPSAQTRFSSSLGRILVSLKAKRDHYNRGERRRNKKNKNKRPQRPYLQNEVELHFGGYHIRSTCECLEFPICREKFYGPLEILRMVGIPFGFSLFLRELATFSSFFSLRGWLLSKGKKEE